MQEGLTSPSVLNMLPWVDSSAMASTMNRELSAITDHVSSRACALVATCTSGGEGWVRPSSAEADSEPSWRVYALAHGNFPRGRVQAVHLATVNGAQQAVFCFSWACRRH